MGDNKRTAGEWKIDSLGNIIIVGSNNAVREELMTQYNKPGDIEFAVKAVNNHYRLIAALRGLLDYCCRQDSRAALEARKALTCAKDG